MARFFWLGTGVLRVMAGAAFAASCAGAQEVAIQPRAHPQTISYPRANLRMDVRMVQIPVTVTDLRGKPILDLRKNNFRIFEDEVEKPIASFFSSDTPVSAGIVFDSSRSMKPRLKDARESVEEFMRTSSEGDEFSLIRFSDKAELLSPFTRDAGEISKQLASIQAKGWTALTDAIILAAHQSRKAVNQRKALVVISDGGDNNSRYTMSELISMLREADIRVYAISLMERPQFLGKICEDTGGRAIWVHKLSELHDAMEQLSLEMRSEYVVGYTPDAQRNDGRYHKVRVTVEPPAGMARLRTSWRHGYFAPNQ
jgi:VWFA-related protein